MGKMKLTRRIEGWERCEPAPRSVLCRRRFGGYLMVDDVMDPAQLKMERDASIRRMAARQKDEPMGLSGSEWFKASFSLFGGGRDEQGS